MPTPERPHLRPVRAPAEPPAPVVAVEAVLTTGRLLLQTIWDHVRSRHPDLPAAALTVLQPGHPLAGYFNPHSDSEHGWELEVGVSLAFGVEEALTTILHEAAHVLGWVRDLRQRGLGGYHTSAYRALAQEVGLAAARHWLGGWVLTCLTPATRRAYRADLAVLERLCAAWPTRPEPRRSAS